MTYAISLAPVTTAELERIARNRIPLALTPEVRARIEVGARFVEQRVERGDLIYGVTTGFGALAERRIRREDVSELQRRHVVSHACGVGDFVDEHVARLALLVKLLTFRGGHTGISLGPVERLVALWNRGLIPAIPAQGTVGASGDLAPLAHMALPLLGLGHLHVDGRIVATREILDEPPVALGPKEGLALTNGIQFITAHGVRAVAEAQHLVRAADLIAALSIQGFSGADQFFAARYHETSAHVERRTVAANLRVLLAGGNHHALPTAVASKQDPYSFRCIPQVHGAVRQTLRFVHEIVEQECNGVSDNPLFFPDEDLVLCGGNLHGESIAMGLDFLAIAVAELASIAERRTYQLLGGRRGLPDFLTAHAGLDSGFMVAQYTSAALVNHNKVLCTPASVDTIPTCQLQEDHVSMGGTSALKLETILANAVIILGIELLTAAQAVELNRGLDVSARTQPVLAAFRRVVPALGEDRVLADDIARAGRFVRDELQMFSDQLG